MKSSFKNSILFILIKEVPFKKLSTTIQKNSQKKPFNISPLKSVRRKKKNENVLMRNGYIIDHLTSVDIQQIVKIGGKVIEIYEGVIYRENFKVNLFRKVIARLFALRQRFKDEGSEVMQILVKLSMNSLYGEQIRKDIEEKIACKSEAWMMSEYDERVK